VRVVGKREYLDLVSEASAKKDIKKR